jgi:hypothetical protein
MSTATCVVRRTPPAFGGYPACVVRRASIALLVALVPLSIANAQVRFERTGYRLTSIGERLAVSARVVDARRRPVANANIRWRIADPTIATVNPQGVVVSRRAGYTKLWAVAGRDSASALILVDQWAAKFDFSPSVVRFDAVGAKLPLRVLVRDAAGHPINDQNRKTAACRSLNERIASLAATGEVLSHTNGVTYVRCTDRGVADSVRVEVRQRALRASIADKLSFGAKLVGDTFRIRINAFDRAGDEIKEVQATWASLDPGVVSIDPLTGLARSIGPGDVKIVGQVGDATDTLSVQVALSPGMQLPQTFVGTDTAGGAGGRGPALVMQSSLYLAEGDESPVSVSARDAFGAAVPNPEVRLMSSDTGVVAVLPGRRVVARKPGEAYVHGLFGTLRDSMKVSVRIKAAATAGGAAEGAGAAAFVRPRFDIEAARARYARSRDSATKAMRRQSIVAEYSGKLLSLSGIAEQAAHSTRLTKGFSETRTGLLLGGMIEAAPHRMIKGTAVYRLGTLATNQPTGEDLTVTEAEADLTFSPAPWFGIRGGYVVRKDATKLANQHWQFPRASIVTRFPFVGGAVVNVMGFSVLPLASYSGQVDATGKEMKPNPFSLAGEAGLELHSGPFSAGVIYYVEKFTFPVLNGEIRKDQFSTIRLRLGLQGGR